MRIFPFDLNIKHDTFKVTFLQTVILKLEYDPENESYEKFASFFKNTFDLQLTEQQYNLKSTDAIRIRSNNHGFRAKFDKDSVEFIINGSDYTNFSDSLKPFIDNLSSLFKTTGCAIKYISIEKVNIWPLVDGDVQNPEDFINIILSKNLLDTPELSKEDNGAFIEFQDSENDNNLLIRFAYIPLCKDKPDQPARIVLDTLCKHDGAPFFWSELPDIAKNLNDILYNAYMWSVSEEVIKAMKQ